MACSHHGECSSVVNDRAVCGQWLTMMCFKLWSTSQEGSSNREWLYIVLMACCLVSQACLKSTERSPHGEVASRRSPSRPSQTLLPFKIYSYIAKVLYFFFKGHSSAGDRLKNVWSNNIPKHLSKDTTVVIVERCLRFMPHRPHHSDFDTRTRLEGLHLVRKPHLFG